ncbi:MAG: hypothetical protein HKN87_20455 [Saprospiraceae bacterium]|nr:hypothetical protein [Saprospiraceae bacterium]
MKQSIFIFSVILLGIIFPVGHEWVFLIRYNLMVMLFLAFLSIDFDWKILNRSHLILLLANLVLPLLLFTLLRPISLTYGLIGFVLGISPTAAAAPVLAQFLRAEVGYVTTAVLLSNPLVALAIPLVLPLLLPVSSSLTVGDVFIPVMIVVGVPLVVSLTIQRASQRLSNQLLRLGPLSFYLFLLNVFIGCGKATHFIRYDSTDTMLTLLGIAGITGIICLMQFKIGERFEGLDLRMASSLSLGRKNTMFGLWLALTFVAPTVALGPIFYIIFQNVYNSFQILQLEKHDRKKDILVG